MSPWTANNPPSVAKNWGADQRRRCVAAANAALRAGNSDQEAIFACIGAAGKGKKQVDEEYDDIVNDGSDRFQELVQLFLEGTITIAVFRAYFRDALELHFTRLMLLGKAGEPPTAQDYVELNRRLAVEYGLLENFITDLINGTITNERALWRAGLYSYARGAYVYYTVPADIVGMIPVLPGDDCLGDGLCHCSLEVEYDAENAYVYWVLNPESESCIVCVGHAVDSPWVFKLDGS